MKAEPKPKAESSAAAARGRAEAWAAAAGEMAWLVAIVLAPCFFDPATLRVFEEDKVYLLRSLALICGAALLGRALARGFTPWRDLARHPALGLVAAWLAVHVVASIFSVAPAESLWGAYLFHHGTVALGTQLVFFVALLLSLERAPQVERLIAALLLATVAPAIYGILQRAQLDPIPWSGDVLERVRSTAGNPIFLGAHLAMIVPLTVACLLATARWATSRRRSIVRTGLAGILLLQLAALYCTQSRGPILGLGSGLTVLALLSPKPRPQRRRAMALALALLGVVAIAIAAIPSTRTALSRAPYAAHMLTADEESGKTLTVRTSLWQAAARLAAADPLRSLIGYGPETLRFTLPPHAPAGLSDLIPDSAVPDRTHNRTLDALAQVGVGGALVELALFVALFELALRRAAVLGLRSQRRRFRTALAGGAMLGAMAPWLWSGNLDAGVPGLCLGIVIGLIAYLAVRWLRDDSAEGDGPATSSILAGRMLPAALLAALVAHFVESQFGVVVAVTELVFWTSAALLVVLEARAPLPLSTNTPLSVRGRARASSRLAFRPSAIGILTAAACASLSYSFRAAEIAPFAAPLPSLALWGVVLLAGAVLALAESPAEAGRSPLRSFLVAVAATWLPIVLVLEAWLGWRPPSYDGSPEAITDLALHLSKSRSVFFVLISVVVAGSSLGWALAEKRERRAAAWAVAMLYVLAVVAGVANLDGARADALARHGQRFEKAQRWEEAERLFLAANELAAEPAYLSLLARSLASRGAAGSPSDAERHYARAAQYLKEVRRAGPPRAWPARDLARVHAQWERRAATDGQRHHDLADRYYGEAVELGSNNLRLWREWVKFHLRRERPLAALAVLERSRAYSVRGHESLVNLRRRAFRLLRGEALTLAQQRFDTDDAPPEYWRRLARRYRERGETLHVPSDATRESP